MPVSRFKKFSGTLLLASMLLLTGADGHAETVEKSARPSLSFFAFFPTFVLPPLIVSLVPSSLFSVVQGKFSKPIEPIEPIENEENAQASESETLPGETAEPEREKADETSESEDSKPETAPETESEAETEAEETAPSESASPASGTSERTEAAEASLEEKAEAGDAEAQYALGVLYEKGRGVSQNYQKALDLLKKSAAQGNAQAKEALEAIAAHSDASGKNEAFLPSKEMRAMMRRAEDGDALSQRLLGFSYEMGHGVARDHAKAVEWYQKAADQGEEEARYSLGFMYESGLGMPYNPAKAVAYYFSPAADGHPLAQEGLQKMISPPSRIEFSPLEKQARAGDDQAQLILGSIYASGQYLPKNEKKAAEWYQKAASQGNKQAKAELKRMKGEKAS